MTHPLYERHRAILDQALGALAKRGYWSAYPESPSGRIYGETAAAEGEAAFKARLNRLFDLDQPGTVGRVGAELSPYGLALGVTYPKSDLDLLLAAAKAALPAWAKAGAEMRAGVCLEILQRINKRSFEIAHAIMHTTGQGFVMAFQAGGPHAQDRGLEAIACAWRAMHETPDRVVWEKPQGKAEPIRLDKTYRIVPRGLSLVIACSTFPTWNSYPALFASLVTGNAAVVKPHPAAILPLAISVEIARGVLKEAGFDPNLVTLAADSADAPIAKMLATRPDIALIDYTGGSAFGDWLERNAHQAIVFTEKAGVNPVVLDSVADLKPVAQNLAFSLSLYSGQMCTTPQNIFVPRDGLTTAMGKLTVEEVGAALAKAVDGLLADPGRATEVLGAIQNPATLKRAEDAPGMGGTVVLAGRPVGHPQYPQARMRTPTILKVDATDERLYMREAFGPVAYLVTIKDTAEAIRLAASGAKCHGAITAAVYSTDPAVLARAEDAMADAGVALSCNLTGNIFVNQSAAFSDFHVTGANPAGNATLTDAAFVASRFRVVQSRMPHAA
jgi:phenylacetic acid degradation protein paaN